MATRLALWYWARDAALHHGWPWHRFCAAADCRTRQCLPPFSDIPALADVMNRTDRRRRGSDPAVFDDAGLPQKPVSETGDW